MAARALKTQQATGICITASHNPAPDNGVKLVEPSGEMLSQEWEVRPCQTCRTPWALPGLNARFRLQGALLCAAPRARAGPAQPPAPPTCPPLATPCALRCTQGVANELANAETDEALATALRLFLGREGIAPGSGTVLIAHDTRPSGPGLAEAAAAGVRALGLQPRLLGLLTTPQLHWTVMRLNQGAPHSEGDYYRELAGAFQQLVGAVEGTAAGPTTPGRQVLHIDCANGVGAPKLAALAPLLRQAGLEVELHNTGGGVLNGGCGSDFIQKDRQLPEGLEGLPPSSRCCRCGWVGG